MTMPKSYYDQSVIYHMPTMDMKRHCILLYLQTLPETGTSFHGYYRTEALQEEIAFIMGWVCEEPGKLNHETQIVPNWLDKRIDLTILRMEEQGYIKLSKTAKCFKVMRKAWKEV